MRDKWEKWVITSIRQRRPVLKPALKVSEILKVQGLPPGYLRMCTDQICDADLIDGEDVRMFLEDFDDLELTADGVISCRNILRNYISGDNLMDAFKVLNECETLWQTSVTIASALKRMSLPHLVKVYMKDSDSTVRKYVLEEVVQRFPWTRWSHKTRNLFIRIKYRRLFSTFSRFCREEAAKTLY